ncbi:MAG: M24 family metallopeptidase [Thermoguttaceae bacterium]
MDRFLARRDKLRKKLKSLGIPALLVTNFLNVSYLTGFSGDDSFLLVHQNGDVIISDPRYQIQISEECNMLEAFIRTGSVSLFSAVEKLVNSQSFSNKKIGVESVSMTLSNRDALADKLPRFEIVGTSGLVESQRMIKDKYEIDAIKNSVNIAKRAFEFVRHSLRKDQTEIELRNDLEYNMQRFGANDRSFKSIIAVGERAALPHAVPTQKKVEESEMLLIDWGAMSYGYVSDLTRVLITTKKPSAKLCRVYETVLKAQKAAIKAIRPGAISGDIDRIARGIIEDAGYGKYFTHGLGHGLGLEVHDSGRLSAGNQMKLAPGMVLTVEPGIYIEGWGGVRIEDDVLVTKTGHATLSSEVNKELEDMVVQL